MVIQGHLGLIIFNESLPLPKNVYRSTTNQAWVYHPQINHLFSATTKHDIQGCVGGAGLGFPSTLPFRHLTPIPRFFNRQAVATLRWVPIF